MWSCTLVEQHGVEVLAQLAAQALAKVGVDIAATAQRLAGLELVLPEAFRDLEGGEDLGRLGRAEALDLAEVADAGDRQLAKATEGLDDGAGVVERRRPGTAGAQNDRQQLGVRQAAGTAPEQLLARPVVGGPVLDWTRWHIGLY